MKDDRIFFTSDEVAKMLGRSADTVRRWARNGEISHTTCVGEQPIRLYNKPEIERVANEKGIDIVDK